MEYKEAGSMEHGAGSPKSEVRRARQARYWGTTWRGEREYRVPSAEYSVPTGR